VASETPTKSRSRRQPPYRHDPRVGRCKHCGLPNDPFGSCKRKACPGYVKLWLRDTRCVLRAGLCAYEGDRVAVLTLTPPQARLLPWDKSACVVRTAHRCSGTLGCRVQLAYAVRFNRSAARRARDLHREARRLANRKTGTELDLLARVWEMQQRGVVHAHYVLPFADADVPTVRAYAEIVRKLAPDPQFAFGYVRLTAHSPSDAASYCTKDLARTVRDPSAPSRICWVSPRLQRLSGRSMRGERLNRAEWHRQQHERKREATSE
jgi:hypothetical protein